MSVYVTGPGNRPSNLKNLNATESFTAVWESGVQRVLFIQNRTTGNLIIAINADSVSPTSADAIVIESGETYITTVHEIEKVAVYASAQAIFSGSGKNATILGWHKLGAIRQ